MTDTQIEIAEIKATLAAMQANIKALEYKINTVSPQCFTAAPIFDADMPLSASAAKSSWPMIAKEFDEYCKDNNVTIWTPTVSQQFYNKYIGLGADFPDTFNDVQNG